MAGGVGGSVSDWRPTQLGRGTGYLALFSQSPPRTRAGGFAGRFSAAMLGKPDGLQWPALRVLGALVSATAATIWSLLPALTNLRGRLGGENTCCAVF